MSSNKQTPEDEELDTLQHMIGLAEDIVDIIKSKKSVTAEMRNNCIDRAKEIADMARELLVKAGTRILVNDAVNGIETTFKQEITKLSMPSQSQPTQNKLSFSTVAKSVSKSKPKPSNVLRTKLSLIVSPVAEKQTRQDVSEQWKKSISFKTVTYAPTKTYPIPGNKIKVEFENTTQRDDTLKRLTSNTDIRVEPEQKLKPMILLKGISSETPTNELIEIIVNQNEQIKNLNPTEDTMKLRFTRKNRNYNLYNAVLLFTPEI
ncbi:hypothetical protein O0L34_g10037 [Tuta absoluta]|nr:hypothetical protein O0L34_g10037 [Tuta absoluta]